MLNLRNILVATAFTLYFLIGAYLSITNGISQDQYHEQQNWIINLDAIKSIINNDNGYQQLLNYKDKYHGIGFHYFSQPICRQDPPVGEDERTRRTGGGRGGR